MEQFESTVNAHQTSTVFIEALDILDLLPYSFYSDMPELLPYCALERKIYIVPLKLLV
jgi:hypothetical protein